MTNYKNIIKQTPEYKSIPPSQSYLVCSEDSLLCQLFVRHHIEDLNEKYNSVDIIELPSAGASKITVADIDYITSTALISPLELHHKYYILKNGDSMQDAAANKLLKTLEEPPPSTKIFILCSNERVVLPTIRSRCSVINISPLNEETLVTALDSTSPSYILAKEASLGNLTRAESISKGEYNDIFDICFEMLLYMKNSTHILTYSSKLIAKTAGAGIPDQPLDKIIWTINLILHEVIKYNLSLKLSLKSRHHDISKIAQSYSPDTIIRLKPIIEKAQKRLATYGNTQSIIDELLFSILEVRQKCNN